MSLTLAGTTITTRKAQAMAVATIEAAFDRPDYAEQLAMMFEAWLQNRRPGWHGRVRTTVAPEQQRNAVRRHGRHLRLLGGRFRRAGRRQHCCHEHRHGRLMIDWLTDYVELMVEGGHSVVMSEPDGFHPDPVGDLPSRTAGLSVDFTEG